MTNEPVPTTPAGHLHRRLTIAFANAADRARLARVICTQPGSCLIEAHDLLPVVDGLARERASSRVAFRACLDTVAGRTMHDCEMARRDLERLVGQRRILVEGATWAEQVKVGMADQIAALDAARDLLDARQAEQRAAQRALDKVLNQRIAANSAIEEADRQLTEMADLGMDEGGLRRELELAGQAARAAQAVHADAAARLAELQAEHAALDLQAEAADELVRAPVLELRGALDALEQGIRPDDVDPQAVTLLSSWAALADQLTELGGTLNDPHHDELVAARRRAELASARLAEIDASHAESAISVEQRAALEAARADVQDATEQVERRASGGARRRLARAQEAEQALLDELGFGSYLEVVVTGGRSGEAHPERGQAEREAFEAVRARDALARQGQASPELANLRNERSRLLKLTSDLLAVDPGTEILPLLHAHRPVAADLQIRLRDALEAVGVRPVGTSLGDAARAFLRGHPLAGAVADPAADRAAEMDAAETEVARADEVLQLADQSVLTLEQELAERSDAEVERMERFAAAEQLKAQVASVASALRRAESEARRSLEQADELVAASEVAFDQASTERSSCAERARRLADALPREERPVGDLLRDLGGLAERLRSHADALGVEIEKGEQAATATSTEMDEALTARRHAGAGDGPMAEDFVEAVERALDGGRGVSLYVFDEPFGEIDDLARAAVLETIRAATASRQIVLLTDDPEVLGWAIDLPPDEVAADPADALLERLVGPEADDEVNPEDETADTEPTRSDPDDTTTSQPAPTGRRWAGQR